jgi:hypothetical protein
MDDIAVSGSGRLPKPKSAKRIDKAIILKALEEKAI